MYVSVCVSVCVCIYIYVHIHIYIHTYIPGVVTHTLPTKQVQIGAALFTGLVFGAVRLDKNADTQLDFEVNSKLVELGNNLVLFFAGLSCEPDFFIEYFRAGTIVAFGYLVMATTLFALIGWGSGLCVGITSVIYFGIACSLSSRQLMNEHLEHHHQVKTMHGRSPTA